MFASIRRDFHYMLLMDERSTPLAARIAARGKPSRGRCRACYRARHHYRQYAVTISSGRRARHRRAASSASMLVRPADDAEALEDAFSPRARMRAAFIRRAAEMMLYRRFHAAALIRRASAPARACRGLAVVSSR